MLTRLCCTDVSRSEDCKFACPSSCAAIGYRKFCLRYVSLIELLTVSTGSVVACCFFLLCNIITIKHQDKYLIIIYQNVINATMFNLKQYP